MKTFKLENFAYLIIFSLPLYLLRVNFFIFPTNLLEILILILFVSWFLKNRNDVDFKKYFSKYKPFIFSIGIIFLGLILSAILNGSQDVSWGIIKSWFIFPLVFIFLLFELIDDKKIEKVFESLFFSALFVSFISLIYLFLGKLTFDFRLEAIFNSPNYLAMYLSPAIIIFLFSKIKKDFLNYLFFGIILISFYFTYSYAAWIATIISIGVIYFIQNKKIFNKKIILLSIVVFFLVLFQTRNQKFEELINLSERSSLTSRIMIWKSVVQMIENNFIFGIGAGNFQDKYLEYQKFFPLYLEWAVPHPHSIFLSFWLYGGILALGGFLSLLFFYFRKIFQKIKKENANVFFVVFGIILLTLIHGLVDTTYFKNDLAIIFWLNFLVLKL